MASIEIPAALRRYTEKQALLSIEANNLSQLINKLLDSYQELRPYIYDQQGDICSYVSIYLNQQDIRFMDRDSTKIVDSDVLSIVPSLAGG